MGKPQNERLHIFDKEVPMLNLFSGNARSEQEVFTELKELCASEGYIYALAFICLKDSTVFYGDKIKAEDMDHLFERERLINTEISSLLGITVQNEIAHTFPSAGQVDEYIHRTYLLMEELHSTFFADIPEIQITNNEATATTLADISSKFPIRESIFYGGESAYGHQYRDFSVLKYSKDDAWLIKNKGFDIRSAVEVVRAVGSLQNEALTAVMEQQREDLMPTRWLDGYKIEPETVSKRSGIDLSITEAVFAAFTLKNKNTDFNTVSDHNWVKATPILEMPDGSLFLLQHYALVEALYESPFYWMGQDEAYKKVASDNRGEFTEGFAYDRLKRVFGESRVFSNIDLYKGKVRLGEIDTLVIYGDRWIILQAKSKRLTLGARKGNDGLLRDDFKKAIQNSYDQGWTCAEALQMQDCILVKPDGSKLDRPKNPKEIFIINLLSDHYPALSLQSAQFLNYRKSDIVKPPFVMDVFLLDALTEMLSTPLRLLGYIRTRVEHIESFQVNHELTALAYHLKRNFGKEDDVDFVSLGDDIAVDLDIAMAVRRDGLPGPATPDGILTKYSGTMFASLISQIEQAGDSKLIDLGFDLLCFDEESCLAIDHGLKQTIERTKHDGERHDFTVGNYRHGSGVTFYCLCVINSESMGRLQHHCELRKYRSKASRWYGVCIDTAGSFQCGVVLDFPWVRSDDMDKKTAHMRASIDPTLTGPNGFLPKPRKIGRNEKCPCGSGKKFKHCHM